MIVLAVDPGAVTGWALVSGGVLVDSGVVREPGPAKSRPTLAHRQAEYARRVAAVTESVSVAEFAHWLDAGGGANGVTLVVEWPTGGGAVRSMASMQRLPWRAGVWLGAVAGAGILAGYVEVAPSEWGACAGLPTGAGFEAAYVERGRLLLGREPETADEAAAVCLAAHAAARLGAGLPVGRNDEERKAATRDGARRGRARKAAKAAEETP